jgi:hypothetical protein
MIQYQKHSRNYGISLLEMLLVLLIATIIVLLGFEHYLTLRQDQDLIALRKNSSLLLSAANTYYRLHINDQIKPFPCDTGVCRTQMIKEGIWPGVIGLDVHGKLLPTKLVATNDENYDISIKDFSVVGCDHCFQLIAKITLKPSLTNLDWYKTTTSAIDYVGSTLEWKSLPGYSIPNMETNLWIFNASLEQFRKDQQKMQ